MAERFRAVVREAEERQILNARPGRTADEAAAEAGRQLPDLRGDLLAAARVFDEVLYGDRRATAEADEKMKQLDDAMRRARLKAPEPIGSST